MLCDIISDVFQQVAGTCQITVCSSKALMRDSWHFQHCTRPQIDPDTLSLQLKKRLKHASHGAGFIRLYKSSLIYSTIARKEIDVYFVNEKSTNRSLSHTVF